MELFKASLLCSLLYRIYGLMQKSRVLTLMSDFSIWVKKLWSGSFFARILKREGFISGSWERSIVCRFITALLNLIPAVLRLLYKLSPRFWDGSLIMKALFSLGGNSSLLLSWMILAVFITPQEYWNNYYSLFGLAGMLGLYYVAAMRERRHGLELKSLGVYAVAFAAFTMLFVILSPNRHSSLRFFMFHFSSMLMVLLIVCSVRSFDELKRILNFVLLGLLIASLYALMQRAQGLQVNRSFVDINVNLNMPGRVFSFFENPNCFAIILVLFLPLSASLACYSKGNIRLFYAFVFAVGTVALIMTGSRGPWLGYVAAILLLALIMRPILVPIFLIVGIFVFPILPSTIYNRVMTIFNPRDSSIQGRQPVYDAALKLIKSNPAGSGLGSEVVKDIVTKTKMYNYRTPFIHAHNLYLQICCEMGVLGLFAFLGTMLTGVKKAFLAITSRKGEKRAVIAGLLSGVAGTLVISLADYPWSYPRIMLIFWLAFALMLSSAKLSRD